MQPLRILWNGWVLLVLSWGQVGLVAAAPVQDESRYQRVVTAIEPFALRVLAGLVAATPDRNVLISPCSLATAFAVLAEGAQGDTRELLFEQLGLGTEGLAATTVGELGKRLSAGGEGATLVVANGVWVAGDLALNKGYVDTAATAFDAAVQALDFADVDSRGRINAWFSIKTGGKIPELLTTLDPKTRLVIGNALHFQGEWQVPFDPERTRPTIFHAPDGDIEVPTLHQSYKAASYRQSDDGLAVRLPFGEGRFDMAFILPAPGKPIAPLLAPGAEGAQAWLGNDWSTTSVRLALPKFTLGTGGSLRPVLLETGLGPLFDRADLGGISPEPLAVGEVVQKVMLTVDERGAEAAAATAIIAVPASAMPPREPVVFTVDRPFAVLIRHVPTGALIVAGVIHNPLEP